MSDGRRPFPRLGRCMPALHSGRSGMRRLSPGLAAVAGLLACAHHYGLDRAREGARALPARSTVYVAMPDPGRLEGRVYPESGRQTQAAIAAAIAPRVAKVELGAS